MCGAGGWCTSGAGSWCLSCAGGDVRGGGGWFYSTGGGRLEGSGGGHAVAAVDSAKVGVEFFNEFIVTVRHPPKAGITVSWNWPLKAFTYVPLSKVSSIFFQPTGAVLVIWTFLAFSIWSLANNSTSEGAFGIVPP